jgi:uncharacterized protein YndB with AHSA1/START domain
MATPGTGKASMKHRFEIDIDAPIDEVWAAFDNPDNLGRWIRNFRSFTPLSGEPGQPGCTAEIVFEERGKSVKVRATITERRQPDFMAATCETPHGSSLLVHHFESVGNGRTRWSSWRNFTFTGMMKYLSLFTAGSIRKRTEGDMQRFKLMVESDLSEV